MSERADPLGTRLDLIGFKQKKPETKASVGDIRRLAKEGSFPSREAGSPEEVTSGEKREERRIYRTGRNAQFSCKVTPETEEQIYWLTDELATRTALQVAGSRWTVGMTVERMVAALKRELT
jgi:hypothetical protein